MTRILMFLLLLAPPAMAQATIAQATIAQATVAKAAGDSTPAIRLPDPGVDDDAPPSAFIAAARTAIALNRLGEAMEAIERAESRLLVRNVRPSLAGTPSDQALVAQLRAARAALARGARAEVLDLLAGVAADPALDAPPAPSRTGE